MVGLPLCLVLNLDMFVCEVIEFSNEIFFIGLFHEMEGWMLI